MSCGRVENCVCQLSSDNYIPSAWMILRVFGSAILSKISIVYLTIERCKSSKTVPAKSPAKQTSLYRSIVSDNPYL